MYQLGDALALIALAVVVSSSSSRKTSGRIQKTVSEKPKSQGSKPTAANSAAKPQKSAIERTKPRTGRPNASDTEARAERLRAIATEVFVEFGYARASLSEIAKRAGASKETFYSQYADKSDLFVAVMTSHLKSALVHFGVLLDEDRSVEKALQKFSFELLTAMLGPYQAFVHLIFAESERFPELGKLFWEMAHIRAYADLARYFRGQIGRKHLVVADPEVMARQFLNMLTSDLMIQSLLNVQRSWSEHHRKAWANATVSGFLRMYGTRSK